MELPPALVAAQNTLAALPIVEAGSKAETEALVLSRANYDVTHSPLSCAASVAEFVVISVCQQMQTRARVAAKMLCAAGSERFARLVYHGVRGSHDGVLRWLRELHAKQKTWQALVKKSPADVAILLAALRPALVSSSALVARGAARLVERLVADATRQKGGRLAEAVRDFFVARKRRGLLAAVACLRARPELASSLKPTIIAA